MALKTLLRKFLALCFLLNSFGVEAQTKIDSLVLQLQKNPADSVKMHIFNNLAIEYSNRNINESQKYAQKALELAEKQKNDLEKSLALHNLGMVEYYKGTRYKALDYFLQALEIRENLGNKKGVAKSANMLGLIYKEQENYDKALEYFFLCLKIRKEVYDVNGIAGCNNNLGIVFMARKEYGKALEYFLKALKTALDKNDKESMGLYYNNIGFIYYSKGDLSLAEDYYLKSKKIREEINDLQGLTNVYTDLGNLYTEKEDFEKAESFLTNSYKIARQIAIIHEVERAAKGLSDLFSKTGNYELAFKYHLIYTSTKDSITDQRLAEKLVQIQMETQFEKEQKLKELEQEKETLENKRKIEKERALRNMFIIGVIGFLIVTIIVYRSYRAKRKDNIMLAFQKEEIIKKNEILNQQNEEILAQRDEIETQRDMATEQRDQISKQNREITDSILYARKIQQALLVSKDDFARILPGSFVFYRPRDIVSGDFYYIAKKGDKIIIAVADCTGHGVPGAFMSMLGLSFINDLVNEKGIERPNVLLNSLREIIISSLKQQDKGNGSNSNEIKDGMDMAVVTINIKNKLLEYSGANCPMYYIKNGETHVEIMKPDNFPVGIHHGESGSFTNHTISISSGDTFYLFSDGFADQFGGPTPQGKKFKYKMFRHLLSWLSTRKIEDQLPALEKTFDDWKGKHDQVDDVMVIGFRF